MNIQCDIFCTVIDNLGDAGVCWRLARQLAREHDWAVRLWIDDPQPLASLCPGINPSLAHQEMDGARICRWQPAFPETTPADVVIEAFACTLPATYIAAMARRPQKPVWINLEYLSAEAWVTRCHGMASPHPTLPLVKYFFFPGFTPGTGGLLRENDADFGAQGFDTTLAISLFCYDNPALPALLDAWATNAAPIICRVADGLPRHQVAAWLGETFATGDTAHRGALTLVALPFVPQADYDRVLGSCDLNFVRGEDSFIRAQWARRPLVWQAYPQADKAHADKLDAFLTHYTANLAPAVAEAVATFWRAWNGKGDIATAWPALQSTLPTLAAHALPWAEEITQPGNLAENLVRFCCGRI